MSSDAQTITYNLPTDNSILVAMGHMLSEAGCRWNGAEAKEGKITLRYKDAKGANRRRIFAADDWAQATVDLGKKLRVPVPQLIARYASGAQTARRSASSRNRRARSEDYAQMATSARRKETRSITERYRARRVWPALAL